MEAVSPRRRRRSTKKAALRVSLKKNHRIRYVECCVVVVEVLYVLGRVGKRCFDAA